MVLCDQVNNYTHTVNDLISYILLLLKEILKVFWIVHLQ